jgi:hypothetical protein
LAAPTGAARIAEATAVASNVPIRGFFIVFIVVLTFSPMPSPFGANPSSGACMCWLSPYQGIQRGLLVFEGITSRTRYPPCSRRIKEMHRAVAAREGCR